MLEHLPELNALLNGCAAVAMAAGFLAIRRGRRELHERLMKTAFAFSVLFLISYLTHHYRTGSRGYARYDWTRPLYFAILISHTILATAVVPMVLVTIHRARKKAWERHKRLARWTFPIWLYVSVTGVIIYLMLYRL